MTHSFQQIAHRGAHLGNSKLENTEQAFQKAVELGADYIECDVQRTHDGVLICFHDDLYQGRPIQEYDFADLQEQLHKEGIALCTFETYVSFWPDIQLDIELKEAGYEESVLELLKGIPLDRYVVKSFQIDAIRALRRLSDVIRIGFLVEQQGFVIDLTLPEAQRQDGITQWLKTLDDTLKLSFISPELILVDATFIAAANDAGLDVWPWTVRTEADLAYLRLLRITTIVTDIPAVSISV